MTALNNKVREQLQDLIRDELRMVDAKAKTVAEDHWKQAEKEVSEELGYGDILTRIEHLQNEIQGLQGELNRLEGSILERGQPASGQDYKECGLDVSLDEYGRVRYKPSVFGHEIRTFWDTKILKHLNDRIQFFSVYTNLNQLQHSVRRELLLAGTFEDARSLYQKFHVKITEAIGDQMPALLSQLNKIPALKKPEENGL